MKNKTEQLKKQLKKRGLWVLQVGKKRVTEARANYDIIAEAELKGRDEREAEILKFINKLKLEDCLTDSFEDFKKELKEQIKNGK